jgi:epoxide hydrolase
MKSIVLLYFFMGFLGLAAIVLLVSVHVASQQRPTPFTWEIPRHLILDFDKRVDGALFPRFKSLSDRNATTGGISIGYMRELVTNWRQHDLARLMRRVSRDSFIVDIDGTAIHFKHMKDDSAAASKKPALLLLHGWPGSILEFERVAQVLRKDHEIVIPSLPGFGLSAHGFGLDIEAIAAIFQKLMQRLSIVRYVVQGGDFGAMISLPLCEQDSACLGRHVNFVPMGAPLQRGLSGLFSVIGAYLFPTWWSDEPDLTQKSINPLKILWWDFGYYHVHSTRPLTLSYGLSDSPLALAAWITEKFLSWSRSPIAQKDILDSLSLYWFARTSGSIQIYFESFSDIAGYLGKGASREMFQKPTGYTSAEDLIQLPKVWLSYYFENIIHYKRVNGVGHFLALEAPALFVDEVNDYIKALEKFQQNRNEEL